MLSLIEILLIYVMALAQCTLMQSCNSLHFLSNHLIKAFEQHNQADVSVGPLFAPNTAMEIANSPLLIM